MNNKQKHFVAALKIRLACRPLLESMLLPSHIYLKTYTLKQLGITMIFTSKLNENYPSIFSYECSYISQQAGHRKTGNCYLTSFTGHLQQVSA